MSVLKDSHASTSISVTLQVSLGSCSQFLYKFFFSLVMVLAQKVLISPLRWKILQSENTLAQISSCALFCDATSNPYIVSKSSLNDWADSSPKY